MLFKKLLLLLINKKYRKKHISFFNLKKLERFKPAIAYVFDSPIKIVDSESFLFQYNEIFIRKIYRFKATTNSPIILDGGSNIGLAIIYWKLLFPQSIIIGFEPDKYIYETLEFNIRSLKLENVTLLNKGLWNKDTELFFVSNGSDGGRITNKSTNNKIEVISLKKYLIEPVDFLKLDIEGAEVIVLEDCAEYLINVKNLFIEYHSFENKQQQLDQLLAIITASGFRYYIQNTGVYSVHPFIYANKCDGFDLQLNIFAYRPYF
jgi:FkbM family methyltransferase